MGVSAGAILEELDFAFMGAGDARKGNWSVFTSSFSGENTYTGFRSSRGIAERWGDLRDCARDGQDARMTQTTDFPLQTG